MPRMIWQEAGPVAREAEARVLRTIVVIFGVLTLVFFCLTISAIIDQSTYLNPVWRVASVVFTFGVPPALAVVSRLVSVTVIRRTLAVYSIGSLFVTFSYLAAMTGPMPFSLSPWPLTVVLGTVPAALVFPSSVAWGLLIINAAAIAVVRTAAAVQPNIEAALQDAMFTLTFTAIFTSLAIVTMRSARALDDAALLARDAAVRRAEAESSLREQARLDALLHDDVMTTLFYASKGDPELDAAVRKQAAHALAELGRSGDAAAEPVEVDAFTSRIRSVALDGAGAVAFRVRGRRTAPIPASVDAAFAEAAAEAVRNSVLHAGRDGHAVSRSTRVVLDEDRVTVTIEDDGVGFEERDVRPHRLGILVSIRGRMAAVAGGSARIDSRLGRGVRVELEWRQG